MTKTTFICSLGFLFFLMACDAEDYEQYPSMHSSDTSGIAAQGKPAQIDLAFITQQLCASYSTHFDDNNTTLSQKIVLLESASLYVPLFTSLKPVGFVLPTTTEAAMFVTDYEDFYENLNVSPQMTGYFDTIAETQDVDYLVLADTVQTDIILTPTEKMQLQFIITYLYETKGDPIEDDTWTKKNIVAAVKGFEKSPANAVFNVALVKIAQQ